MHFCGVPIIWEDWVHYPISQDYFPKPIYADEEIDALLEFADAFLAFRDASEPWPDSYAELTAKNYWTPFVVAASKTLKVLANRGRLPENVIAN